MGVTSEVNSFQYLTHFKLCYQRSLIDFSKRLGRCIAHTEENEQNHSMMSFACNWKKIQWIQTLHTFTSWETVFSLGLKSNNTWLE